MSIERKSRRSGVPRDLGQRARELDAGGPAAGDDERQPLGPPRGVVLALGRLEGDQDPSPDLERVIDRLEAGRVAGPLVVAEVREPGAGGDDEGVVGDRPAVGHGDLALRRIDPDRLAEEDGGVPVASQDRAERLRDVAGRDRAGRDLVEQRREQVEVAAVDDGQVDARVPAELAGGVEPAEAAPDDQDPMPRSLRLLDHEAECIPEIVGRYSGAMDQPRPGAALGVEPIRTIDRDELKAKLDRGDDIKPIMALNRWAFDAKHIPGSIHFDTPEALYAAVHPEDEVIVYCSHVDCLSSVAVYRDLVRRGYRNVAPLLGRTARLGGRGTAPGGRDGGRVMTADDRLLANPTPHGPYAAELEAERAGWYEIADLVRSLTPDECLVPGYYEDPDWTVRDVVAHLGTWLAEAQAQLERISAATYEGHDVDIDAMNAEFLAAMAGHPWEVAWVQANAGRSRMVDEWSRLHLPTDEAAWWIRKSGGDHYAEHLDRLREWTAALIDRRRP